MSPRVKLAVAAVVLLAWMCSGSGASACEELKGTAGEPVLQTNRPVRGDDVRLAAGFGMRLHPLLQINRPHNGVDWAAPIGTPVIAAAGGRVVSANNRGEYGNAVVIDHGGGWRTLYAHLSRIAVREGDCVAFGTTIGNVGSTGLTEFPGLHFELHRDGRHLDPMIVPIKH